jgi:hypothetical protein
VHHLYSQTNEEFIADLLAAKWGYAEELSDYRRAERGEEYVHILRNWQDEKAFVASVDAWHIAWVTAALVRGADRPNRRPTSM